MAGRAVSGQRALRHKVVELVNVTAEDLGDTLDRMAADGWNLDRIDYVKEPGIRRPQMAFLFFVSERAVDTDDADA